MIEKHDLEQEPQDHLVTLAHGGSFSDAVCYELNYKNL
jgi:hypothetical protein